jgi:hypothetical protein
MAELSRRRLRSLNERISISDWSAAKGCLITRQRLGLSHKFVEQQALIVQKGQLMLVTAHGQLMLAKELVCPGIRFGCTISLIYKSTFMS